MTINLNQFITEIKINGTLLTHQEPNAEIGVKENRASCYLKSKKVLIKGEEANPKSGQRRAFITLTNLKTNEIKGMQKGKMGFNTF